MGERLVIRNAEEQKSKRAKEQKSKRTEEQKSNRAKEQKNRRKEEQQSKRTWQLYETRAAGFWPRGAVFDRGAFVLLVF